MRTTDDAKDTSLIHPVSFQPTANKPQDELQNSLKQLITKNLILSLLSMLLKQGFCFWPPKRRTQWLRSHAPNTIKYILPEFLCRTTPLHCCLIHSDARGEFISYNHQDLAASNRQGPFLTNWTFQLTIWGQDFSCIITTVLSTLICMNTGGHCRLFEHSNLIKEEQLWQTTCPYFKILKNWTYTQFACKVTLH